jgi:asparagine synthase (glutamine-hydrolysing)
LPVATSWLTGDAAQWAAQRAQQFAVRSPEYVDPGQMFDWWEARRTTARLAMTAALAASFGLQLHDPYADLRVLELCLAIPSRLREPAGSFKPLVTQTLADLLPRDLTSRTSKDTLGIGDAVQRGLRHNASTVRALIASESSQLIRAGLIDRAAITRALELAIMGANVYTELDSLIAIELWLAKPREPWWKEGQ